MFAEPIITQQGQNYTVQYGTDRNLIVQFYMEAVKDEEASREAGREISVDKEYIKIMFAGDKNTVRCRPVDLKGSNTVPPDNIRFPAQYAAFKAQQEQPMTGTLLQSWPVLSKAQVLNLKACNVHTLEQLASVTDQNLHNLGMGARELRDKAIAYIEAGQSNAVLMAAQDEIAELKRQIAAMQNQMAGLAQDEEIKKRGRPKKEVNDDTNTIGDDTASS